MAVEHAGDPLATARRGGWWLRLTAALIGAGALAGVLAGWGRFLPGGAGVDPVARLLLAVALVLVVCHLCGAVLVRLGQPAVVGEILGGILLGPSVLGVAWPAAAAWLFPPPVLGTISLMAQVGLVMFMFLLGFELRVEVLRASRKAVSWVLVGSVALPFAAGTALALPLYSHLAGKSADLMGYALFTGVALSITAVPVLAVILADLDLTGTRLGVVAMTCAVVGDGLAWAVLTLLLAVSGHGGAAQMASTVGITLALVIFMVWCVRPALAAYIRFVEKRGVADRLLLPVLIAVAIAAAGATGMIGLHPVIGAFLAGVIVPRRPAVEAIGRQLRGFVLIILLPLFFAGIGLSTSIGIVFASPAGWLVFLAVFVVAIVTKFLGAGGAARLNGFPAAQAVGLGALMNCRGVTELIVASIGLQAGLVSRVGFNVLVLVALITSMVTMPTVRKFIPEARRGRGDPSITRPAGP